MHVLANKATLEALLEGKLLKGNLEDMMKVNLAGKVFQPHGLGHLIGIEVHDVGGYAPGTPERPQGSGLRGLRTARVLKENMAITLEPGCYFIDHLLDSALADAELKDFLVVEELERFRGFGGVRIEDDCVVRKDGFELLSRTPRTVAEVEKWMAEGDLQTLDSVARFNKSLKA